MRGLTSSAFIFFFLVSSLSLHSGTKFDFLFYTPPPVAVDAQDLDQTIFALTHQVTLNLDLRTLFKNNPRVSCFYDFSTNHVKLIDRDPLLYIKIRDGIPLTLTPRTIIFPFHFFT